MLSKATELKAIFLRRTFGSRESPELLSSYIERISHSPNGFYSRANRYPPLPSPLNFFELQGISHYMNELGRHMPNHINVPVGDAVSPYMGYTIGAYILEVVNKFELEEIKIVDINPTSGTLIKDIIDFMQNYALRDFESRLSVGIVPLYPTHSSICMYEDIERKWGCLGDRLHIERKHSLWEMESSQLPKALRGENVFVIGSELLEVLPHDKLIIDKGKLNEEAIVKYTGTAPPSETLRPISDPWCLKFKEVYERHYLDFVTTKRIIHQESLAARAGSLLDQYFAQTPPYSAAQQSIFAPTYALRLFSLLHTFFPSHNLILADFDSLHSIIKPSGLAAPLVTYIQDDLPYNNNHKVETRALPNYLLEEKDKGKVEVIFPTDFYLLQKLYHSISGKESKIRKGYELFSSFGCKHWATCKNDAKPMFSYYDNFSFMIPFDQHILDEADI